MKACWNRQGWKIVMNTWNRTIEARYTVFAIWEPGKAPWCPELKMIRVDLTEWVVLETIFFSFLFFSFLSFFFFFMRTAVRKTMRCTMFKIDEPRRSIIINWKCSIEIGRITWLISWKRLFYIFNFILRAIILFSKFKYYFILKK